jgi:cell shape-determining protein MreD
MPWGLILPLLANLLLIFLSGLVGHWLTPWGLAVYVGALAVVFPATHLSLGSGMLVAALTGLAWDAVLPVPMGTSYVLFTAAVAATHLLGRRLRKEATLHLMVLAQMLNAALLLALGAWMSTRFTDPAGWRYWAGILTTLVLSSALVALLTGWFVALQRGLLQIILGSEGARRTRGGDIARSPTLEPPQADPHR